MRPCDRPSDGFPQLTRRPCRRPSKGQAPRATLRPIRGPDLGVHHPATYRRRPARHRRPLLIPGPDQVSREGGEQIMGEVRRRWICGVKDFYGSEWDQGVGRRVWMDLSTVRQSRRSPSPACRHPLPVNGERKAIPTRRCLLHIRQTFPATFPRGGQAGR